MSKTIKICIIALAALLIGGFIFVASIDVPVKKSQVVKTISNERFFKNN